MTAAPRPTRDLPPAVRDAFDAWLVADATARTAGTPGYKAAATRALDALRASAVAAGLTPAPLRLATASDPLPPSSDPSERAQRAPRAGSGRSRPASAPAPRETRASILASGRVRIVRTPEQVWPDGVPDVGAWKYRGRALGIPICKPESAPDWLSVRSIREMSPLEIDRELQKHVTRWKKGGHPGLSGSEIVEVGE